NSSTGFEQLKAWLSKQGVERIHACLEATGTNSEPLALYLTEAGHRVSLINPAATKAFAESRLLALITAEFKRRSNSAITAYKNYFQQFQKPCLVSLDHVSVVVNIAVYPSP